MQERFRAIYEDLYSDFSGAAERSRLDAIQEAATSGAETISQSIEQVQARLSNGRLPQLREDAKFLLLTCFTQMVYEPLTIEGRQPVESITDIIDHDIWTIATSAGQSNPYGGQISAHAVLNTLPKIWDSIKAGAFGLWEGDVSYGAHMQDEDLRAAATIATSLSGFVMTGALALMGAEAAIFVFLLDKKVISFWFWGLLLVCFCSLFFSCYLGGRGIWNIYADGATGNWHTSAGGLFKFQFALSLLGLILLIVSSIAASFAPAKQETNPNILSNPNVHATPVPKPKSLGQPAQKLQPPPVVPAKSPSAPPGN